MGHPNDNYWMQYAIDLASERQGIASPNPTVGAVLVKDGVCIGVGVTEPYGGAHAEVVALRSSMVDATGGILYVTLEPCNHYGKTPPCTKAIIEAKLSRVVIAHTDPNPLVAGAGVKALEEAGIQVTQGILKEAAARTLQPFLTAMTKKCPYVFMKIAASLDAKTADQYGESKWITNLEARLFAHKLRRSSDAIITGIGTVLIDDPLYSVRIPETDWHKQPLRVILDPELKLPFTSQIVQTAHTIPTMLICSSKLAQAANVTSYINMGIQIEFMETNDSYLPLKRVLALLFEKGCYSIMVEAGAELSSSFLRDHLVDRLYYILAPKLIGKGRNALLDIGTSHLSEVVDLEIEAIERLGADVCITIHMESPNT